MSFSYSPPPLTDIEAVSRSSLLRVEPRCQTAPGLTLPHHLPRQHETRHFSSSLKTCSVVGCFHCWQPDWCSTDRIPLLFSDFPTIDLIFISPPLFNFPRLLVRLITFSCIIDHLGFFWELLLSFLLLIILCIVLINRFFYGLCFFCLV